MSLLIFLSFSSHVNSVWMSTLWVMELSRQLCGKMRRSGRKAHLSSPPATTFGLELHFYTPGMQQLKYLSGCYTAEELCVTAAKKCCKWQACLLLKYLCASFYDTLKSNNQVDPQPYLLITKSQSYTVLCNTWNCQQRAKNLGCYLIELPHWKCKETQKTHVHREREKQKLRLQHTQRQCGINFVQSYWLSAAIWAVNMSDKMH